MSRLAPHLHGAGLYLHAARGGASLCLMLRRSQKPLTIRSDRAAARLAILTRDGRSQAAVIEEALDRMPTPMIEDDDLTKRIARIEAILDRTSARGAPSIQEFDAKEFDDHGMCR